MMNAGTRGTQIPSILSSERGIVGRGKKDREGPPPGSGGWGGVTGAHVTFQGGCDDSSWTLTCTTSTSALHVHESGDTVGDYIHRGPLRGGWSPGTLMWWWQVCASEREAGGLNCGNPPCWLNNFQTDLVFQNIVIYRWLVQQKPHTQALGSQWQNHCPVSQCVSQWDWEDPLWNVSAT